MIKGIDAQIMTGRVTDFLKDTSAALKRPELNHDFMAKMIDAEKQKELQGVKHLEKQDPSARVRERDPQNQEQQEKKKHQENSVAEVISANGFIEAELSVGYGERKILDLEV